MPFFNVNKTPQQGKFTTSVFLKPTFTEFIIILTVSHHRPTNLHDLYIAI